MIKRFIVLLIAFTFAGSVAQAQISQADKLFKSYSYSLAIPHYLKIAQKPGSPDRNYAMARLADCYRLTNDQLNAKAWYAKVVDAPGCENINWFYYGEALRCAEDYDLAKKAFEKFQSLEPDDPRGKAYAEFCNAVPRLKQQAPLFEIKNATALNSDKSDFGPAFYNDGIVFVSDRKQNLMENKKYEWTNSNYLDLYFATPRYMDEFYQEMNEPKTLTGKFNQTYHDGPATFAKHDSIIFFTRTDKGKEKKDSDNFRTDRLKIFWAEYKGSWSKTKPFFFNSDDFSIGHPVLTPDADTLFFVSDMPGGEGGTDIYFCRWMDGQWEQPENMGTSVNTFGDEMFPSVNGNELYFASNGLAGFGGLDIYKSKLVKGKWTKAENLGMPINSAFDDFAMVLDKRGKKGFFSSNRPGGAGSDDIYACKKSDKPILPLASIDTVSKEISGYVRDKQTLTPLPGTTVFLLNTQTGKVQVIKTDSKGRFKARIDKEIFYVAKAMENNYLADCINFKFATTDTASKVSTPRDLLLDKLEVNKIFAINNMDYSIETIYYDFNKYFIRPDAEAELDKLVQIMKENPVSVELGSHTDSRGSREYNLDLSQKRAESAVRYIVLQGIEASRITAKGYGESQLINQCTDGVYCSAAEHQANRRTEFKVTGIDQTKTNTEYDMQKFNGGEEIPVYMFDRDFFINCLEEKRMSKPTSSVTTPAQQQVESTETSQNDDYQPASEPVKPVAQPARATANTNAARVSAPATEPVKTAPTQSQPAAVSTAPTNNGSVTYRVQLLALSHEKSLLDPEFESFTDVQMYIEDGLYKYTTGVFSTHEEALNFRSQVVNMGYDDAFVVTFANNKRIYVTPSF